MSTQVLNNALLPTVAEVESMLEAVVVTEETIDGKITTAKEDMLTKVDELKDYVDATKSAIDAEIATETNTRAATDTTLDDNIKTEASIRETTDDELKTRITREEAAREASVGQLATTVSTLADTVSNHDEQIRNNQADIQGLSAVEKETFEDTLFCVKLSNLPIAQMTIENKDRTIIVGDILGTVSAAYIPYTPITTNFVTEVDVKAADGTTETKYAYLSCRLDANGNVIVVNKTILADEYTGNVNSSTVMYITKE